MVYCGKASQACQNCRVRRIKCDKLRPDCSQCVRIAKKCPGYRDQLSLMFRDESNKVIKKAHAQWGAEGGEQQDQDTTNQSMAMIVESESSPSSSTSLISLKSSARDGASSLASSSPALDTDAKLSNPLELLDSATLLRISSHPDLTPEDLGRRFFIDRFVIGHPDEPSTAAEIQGDETLWHPCVQNIMAAVGLASVANLQGSPEFMVHARRRYVTALRQTGQLIQKTDTQSVNTAMRAVIMLAMFELVKESHTSTEGVQAHVNGAAALMRSCAPFAHLGLNRVRALIQLAYSMFIHAEVDGVELPVTFNEWFVFCASRVEAVDRPAVELGSLISRFLEISARRRQHVLEDGFPATEAVIRQAVDIESDFASWERGLSGEWLYRTETANKLPAQAVFDGQYHVYFDLWYARVWGHYRWARILLNQIIYELAFDNPTSAKTVFPESRLKETAQVIQDLARDVLVSVPTHWRHPLLKNHRSGFIDNIGGAGSGSAGLPILLFHLKSACCAPTVPSRYWAWGQATIESIWGDMGMLHARSMMDSMLQHRVTLDRIAASPS